MVQTSSELIKSFEQLTSQREKVVKELAVLESEQNKAKHHESITAYPSAHSVPE